ncbi:MAG: ABC transporter permease [Clostridiales bacterium]|nr:ABC transporter permease [Clostridiales bacterium]
MKRGFYPKLAFSGIAKNKKIYVPYLLTCIGMVMMYYIICFLSTNENVAGVRGGDMMQMILSLGIGVIGVFAAVFLFYTNSFLMRNRKKEFGLYNILGMGKWNIMRMLIWESLILWAISIVGGLALGILFSKAAELIMVRTLGAKATFTFSIGADAVVSSIFVFAAIFFVILLRAVWQIHLSKPVELLKGDQVGEKPPKANFVLAFLGIAVLAGAYYLALTIQNAVDALTLFFVAVIMVIIATYILFIAGSVVFCRLLQKNKKYYYKTNHFISVSSMTYRMKRNGAGLASICILSTMVLVMLSSTSCLWVGSEDSLGRRYPRDIIINTQTIDESALSVVDEVVEQTLAEQGLAKENVLRYRYLNLTGFMADDSVVFDQDKIERFSIADSGRIRQIIFVPIEDYNRMLGDNISLKEDEVMLYHASDNEQYTYSYLELEGLGPMRVAGSVTYFVENGTSAAMVVPSIYVFVKDVSIIEHMYAYQQELFGEFQSFTHDYYGFDLSTDDEAKLQLEETLRAALREIGIQNKNAPSIRIEGLVSERGSFYALNAGIFFLGILLGIVFIAGAVLIMYYKQVTEGYEDKDKFEILKKVGMRRGEIKKSINSQVLTVFFMPLIAAGIHTAFAFPLVRQLLMLFQLYNTKLFLFVTLASFILFAVFYTIVYLLTSKVYYSIVSGSKKE